MKKAMLQFLLTWATLFPLFGLSQSYSSGLTVQMNGYLLNTGGEILFQPSEDSTKSVWESLDNTSFSLWYFRETLYLEAISNIGDSAIINITDTKTNENSTTNFSYFYCTLIVNMMFLDTSRFKVYQKPQYQIKYGGKSHLIKGFSVDNRIIQLIPKSDKNLALMYNYYKKHNLTVPNWLDQVYIRRIGK